MKNTSNQKATLATKNNLEACLSKILTLQSTAKQMELDALIFALDQAQKQLTKAKNLRMSLDKKFSKSVLDGLDGRIKSSETIMTEVTGLIAAKQSEQTQLASAKANVTVNHVSSEDEQSIVDPNVTASTDIQEMNLDEITQEWLFGREQVENVEEAAESKSSLRKLGLVKLKTGSVDLQQIALADFFDAEDAPAVENRLGNADIRSLCEEVIESNVTNSNGDADLHITGLSSVNDLQPPTTSMTLECGVYTDPLKRRAEEWPFGGYEGFDDKYFAVETLQSQSAPSVYVYSRQEAGPVEKALDKEIMRLTAKASKATGVEGFFWKSSYQAKSAAAASAYTDLLAAYENQADKTVSREAFITQAIQDPTSSIYKALNTHSSYVFRFNASPLSFKARALLNIEKVIEDNKPPATEVSETVSFSAI